MNRIAISILLAAGLLLFCSTSFTTPFTPSNPASSTRTIRNTSYYWFLYPSDQFNDYASLTAEEEEWWYYYDGVVINTNPIGGTLIARGYLNGNYPHTSYPSAFIYAHFTY